MLFSIGWLLFFNKIQTMIWTIAKKEIQETIREGRFKVAAGLLLVLLFTTFALNYQYQLRQQKEHQIASEAERHLWEHQPEKNPHGAAHFGVFVFKPVYPLSILDPGVNYYNGTTLYLEAHKRNSELFAPVQDATSLARFGDMRPAFVLLYLFPLFIVLLGYNLLTKEREAKTLSLLMAQGVSNYQIVAGKWVALSTIVLVFHLPVVLVSSFVLNNFPGFSLSSFLLFNGLYLLYYFVFINLTLLVSVLAKRSGAAFISLLLFWIVTTVLLPKLFSNIANERYPLPTNEQMAKNIAELNKGRGNIHDLVGDAYKRAVDSLLKVYGVDSVSDLPVNMAGIRLDLGEQQDTRNAESQFTLVKEKLNAQKQLYNAGGWLSPFLSAKAGSMELAGTDLSSHWRFTDSAERYRRVFVNRMNRAIAYESGKQEAFTEYKATSALWKEVPRFRYDVKPSGQENAQPSFLTLCFWCLLTGLGLRIFSNRLNPLA